VRDRVEGSGPKVSSARVLVNGKNKTPKADCSGEKRDESRKIEIKRNIPKFLAFSYGLVARYAKARLRTDETPEGR